MILASILRALSQFGDPRFLRVTGLGIALSLGLLAGLYALLAGLVGLVVPETVTLPWWGEVQILRPLLDWASLLLVLVLSVFLMVPVAALFSGLFLDRVADAVEDRYYPGLPPVRPRPFLAALRANLAFTAFLLAANVVGLVLYILSGPFAPLVFVGLNGWLLGREYFDLAATRRIGADEARDLRRRNAHLIWLAGIVMAAPLAIPVVNLFVPVLGAAAFTHLFHALRQSGRS